MDTSDMVVDATKTTTVTTNDDDNQNKTSSSSEDISINEDWIDNISPTISNLLVGFDCQNPTEVDSFELESVKQCEERIQNSTTKEAYVQILQKSEEYP